MKKLILILYLLFYLAFGISSQSTGQIDLIVLLDTSSSMSVHYKETSDYLIGPFLREFLRLGDTFHLISFSGSPRLEISRRVEGIGDVETVIARILLMYPLDPESDLSGALSFAERYSSSLQGGRSKKLVIVSDGDIPGTENLINGSVDRFKNQGTDLQYIKVPVTGTGPLSGRPVQAGQQPLSQVPAVSAQGPGGQSSSGQGGLTDGQSQQGQQRTGEDAQGGAGQVAATGADSQQRAGEGITGTTGAGSTDTGTTGAGTTGAGSEGTSGPGTTGGGTQPGSGTSQTTGQTETQAGGQSSIAGGGALAGIPLPLLIALGILILLILVLLIFFITRRLHSSPNRVIAKAVTPQDSRDDQLLSSYAQAQKAEARPSIEYPPPKSKPLPKDKHYDEQDFVSSNGEPLLLNLFVEDQNTAIGRRNVHSVKSGYTFTIGGGKSDFLIFLVSVPPNIAEVHYDGRNCTLIPRKPQYFPDIGSQAVYNCIGKTVRIISDKNYEMHMRIEKYEDPLQKLNKILRSIQVPGPSPR